MLFLLSLLVCLVFVFVVCYGLCTYTQIISMDLLHFTLPSVSILAFSLFSLLSCSFSLLHWFLSSSPCVCVTSRHRLCSQETNKASPTRGLTNGDPGIEHTVLIPINVSPPPMNTRSTPNLTDTPINDLLSTCTKRTEESEPPTNHGPESVISDPSSVKQGKPSPPIEDQLSSVPRSPPTMSDAEDILELQEVQRKRSELERRFLQKIPVFKSVEDSDGQEFLAKAESVFIQLRYTDEIRLLRIRDKLDESLQPCIDRCLKKNNATWNDFKHDLLTHLNRPSLLIYPLPKAKRCLIDSSVPWNHNSKPSVLELLRRQVTPFSGEDNARHWFMLIDSKFSEAKTSLTDRLGILPHFLTGDAMLWFSCNKHKMQCYTDFCREFAIDYLQPSQTFGRNTFVDRKNDRQSLQSSVPINVSTSVPPLHSPNEKPPAILGRDVPSTDTPSIISSSSVLSPATSKALIDKFMKDPIKFSGGKDKVTTWIDEVNQQFKTMHLNGLRSPLSTETRRNHLKTTAEFLEQVKRAEEIPGVQFDPGVELIDRRRAATTVRLINCRISAASTSDHQCHRHPSNADHPNRNSFYSSNNNDQHAMWWPIRSFRFCLIRSRLSYRWWPQW